jgi:hypothetical protein
MEGLHRPTIVAKAENAVVYFLIFGVITVGIGFIAAGAVSPVFIPWGFHRARRVALEYPPEDYRKALWTGRIMVLCFITIWCFVSWMIIWFFNTHYASY